MIKLFYKNCNLFRLIFIFLIISSLSIFSKGIRWSNPTNLINLNSEANDFAPSFNKYTNTLYFNSDISNKSLFYIAEFNSEGEFNDPKLLKSAINPIMGNQSYISFSTREESYYSKYKKYSRQSYLNIYKSVYIKNEWSNSIIVDSLAIEGFCSHPTISPDGNILIFTSTKENPGNETDLWMSYRNENGSWGIPFKIDELNTSGNEITPFLQSSDTLYFASDGFEGPGGFDVYMSVFKNNFWNRPFPVTDINTEFNESDFIIIDNFAAVFASDRAGGKGGLDLYISKFESSNYYLQTNNLSEISLLTQVNNILVSKNSIVSKFPSFHFFLRNSFDNENILSGNLIDSLLLIYPTIISKFLKDYPNEIIVVDSTNLNHKINIFFESQGINNERVKFQKSIDGENFIRCRLLSGNPLNVIEKSIDKFSVKPPVIEYTIDSRINIKPKTHSLEISTKNKINKIDIDFKSIPFRDIIPLDDITDELFDSDTFSIKYKLIDDLDKPSFCNKTILVNREITKETAISEIDNKKYEEYYFVIPDNIFLNSDYFPIEYFNQMIQSILSSKRIKIFYYNKDNSTQANKLKDLILQRTKNIKIPIEVIQQNYIENEIFSNKISYMITKILLEK